MNVTEALEILKAKGITDSIQMVRRWLRSGELKGTRSANRKAGYEIREEDLEAFIRQRLDVDRKGESEELARLRAEVENLRARVEELEKENRELRAVAENKSPVSDGDQKRAAQELTREEAEEIWRADRSKFKYPDEVQKAAHESFIKLLFRLGPDGRLGPERNVTNLYDERYKNPYVCPNTGRKFSSAQKLVAALIPRLLESVAIVQQRKIEKTGNAR